MKVVELGSQVKCFDCHILRKKKNVPTKNVNQSHENDG